MNSPKRYLLGGWLPPLTNPSDADYCEFGCPVCRRARAGNRLARLAQRLELLLTRGGCPWGRARQQKYGVPPDQPLPRGPDSAGDPVQKIQNKP